jgi:hypothetical protein
LGGQDEARRVPPVEHVGVAGRIEEQSKPQNQWLFPVRCRTKRCFSIVQRVAQPRAQFGKA